MKQKPQQLTKLILSGIILLHPLLTATAIPENPRVFKNVKLLVKTGDKIKETDAVISFERARMVIRSAELGVHLKAFPYSEIKNADYSYSTHPLWQTGEGAGRVVHVFALPVFFMKGKKHWLSIKTTKDYAVLHLDKNNYQNIIPAFETHTKVKVAHLGEEK